MISLTPRQADALAVIERYIAGHGHGPSLGDVAAALGLRQRGHVHRLLTALRERGHITWVPRLSRSITLLRQSATSPLVLPSDLQARLAAHCAMTGDAPADVITEALAVHLDAVRTSQEVSRHG